MSRARALVRTTCLASVLLTACDQSHRYQGDGTLTDFGPTAAINRYVVDLGPIDLSHPNQRSYKMRGLPPVEMTMGFRQVSVSTGCDAAALASIRVRLNVQEEDNAVVVAEEGPLSAWISSTDLVYKAGAEHEEPTGGGATHFVRTGTRASGGWGTYFTPRSSTIYVARFTVLDSRGASDCGSRLVLLGGGWK
jgi:hypothetical protein